MNVRIGFFALMIGVGALASGCKKDEGAKQEPAQPTAKKEDKARKATDDKAPKVTDDKAPKAASADFVATIMKPYEDCRALLAADKREGIAECAKAMSDAAKAAASSASEGAKEPLASIASAADALAAAADADDLEKIRALYGEVSKPVVAMLTAIPEAAKDYHVFECPMAKGYKRWAQADKKIANPYMGTKMLECGSEVHDHHKGMMDEGHSGMKEGHMDGAKHGHEGH